MRLMVLTVVALLSSCVSFGDWKSTDRVLLATLLTCEVVDHVQTESMLDQPGYEESNPLIGAHPSDKKLVMFNVARVGATWWLADVVPSSDRTIVFGSWLGFCALAVINNAIVKGE